MKPKMYYRIFVLHRGRISPLRTEEFEKDQKNNFDNDKDAYDWINENFKDENDPREATYELIVWPAFQVKPLVELDD